MANVAEQQSPNHLIVDSDCVTYGRCVFMQ